MQNPDESSDFIITAVCTVTDPAERQRRLAQVYERIMSFSLEKKAVAETEPEAPVRRTG